MMFSPGKENPLKKIAVLLFSALMLSACTSLQKVAGVASEEKVAAADAALSEELAALKVQVAELSASASRVDELQQSVGALKIQSEELASLRLRMDALESGAAEMADIRTLMEELRGRIDLLPRESLTQLIRILQAALESGI